MRTWSGGYDHRGMRLLATFFTQFWTFILVILVDSTFAGKDFISEIAQEYGWQLEHTYLFLV